MLTQHKIEEIVQTLKDMDHFLRNRLIPIVERSSHFEFMKDCQEFVQKMQHLMSFRIELNETTDAALSELVENTQTNINSWIDTLREFVAAKQVAGATFDDRPYLAKVSAAHRRTVKAFTADAKRLREQLSLIGGGAGNIEPESQSRIFICYRREDTQLMVDRLYRSLVGKFNEIVRDINSIPVGLPFAEVIVEKLRQMDYCLVAIGPRWLEKPFWGRPRLFNKDDYVRFEIETALTLGIRTVPVIVPPAVMPSKAQLPPTIARWRHCMPYN